MDIQQWGDRELRDLAAMIRHYRKAGLWKDAPDFTQTAIRSGEILVKNTETSAIPAYGCMQIDGTVSEGATDDKRLYVKVKKPTGTTGSYLFNGHYEIEASGYGVGLDGPHVRGYKNSGTITLGDRWAPTSGQWYLTKTPIGQYIVIGDDDISTNVFRLMISYDVKFFLAELTSAWSGTAPNITATADLFDMADNDLSTSVTVRDPLGTFASLTSGDRLEVKCQLGSVYTNQAPCP